MTFPRSSSLEIMEEMNVLSPLRWVQPNCHSQLTIAGSDNSGSLPHTLFIQVPQTSPLAIRRHPTEPVASGRQPASPPCRESDSCSGDEKGKIAASAQLARPSRLTPLKTSVPTTALASRTASQRDAPSPLPPRDASPAPEQPQLGVESPSPEDVAVLRANNAVLQRNVETLKALAQRLATDLKAAQSTNLRRSGSSSGSGLDAAAEAAPSQAQEEAEVRYVALAQQYQEQMDQLHRALAEKDAVIARLTQDLEHQHQPWMHDYKRVVKEKNSIIASLVSDASERRRHP